jgi:hypothetical protein
MGRLDVGAMLGEMTAEEFGGWRAFAELEPFGSLRDDYRAARCAALVANNIPLRGKGARALKPEDVFVTLSESRRQSREEIAAHAKWLVAAMGGEIVEAGRG